MLVRSEEQFFHIFLTSSSKALIANYKILVTKQWQVTRKRCICFMEMKRGLPCGHLLLIHESVYSHRSSVHEVCFGWSACPTHSPSSMQGQRFPSSTWTLTRSSCFPRQPWCIPAAWHFWHGLAQLGSVGLQQRWQGLLCVNWSCCTAADVYFVDC